MPKDFLLLVLAVGVILFLMEFIQTRLRRSTARPGTPPAHVFIRQPALLSDAEKKLFLKLSRAAGEQKQVFCKVRLSEVVKVRARAGTAEAGMATDEISAIMLDFVICRRSDLSVAAAVRIAGGSSRRAASAEAVYARHALTGAGIPLIRIAPEKEYSIERLRGELQSSARRAGGVEILPGHRKTARPCARTGPRSVASLSSPCPACGTRLVERRIKGGRLNGSAVLACPNFPACKHVLPLAVSPAATG